MDDPCFCHFNGFAVKDATARKLIKEETKDRQQAIAQETEARQQAIAQETKARQREIGQESEDRQRDIAGMQAVDITDKFPLKELFYGGEDLTTFEVLTKKFVYCPAQGIVFFRIAFKMIGFFPKEEPIAIDLFNEYSPDARYEGMPAMCHPEKFSARTFNDCITLNISENTEYTEDLPGSVIISGWWFSNGNHDELEGDDL